MNISYLFYSFCAIMIVVIAGSQIVNTLSFEASTPYPTDEEIYYGGDMSVRSEQYKNVANAYSAYEANWAAHANVNPVFPATLLIGFFGFIGYLYYDEWKNEVPYEMFSRYGGY